MKSRRPFPIFALGGFVVLLAFAAGFPAVSRADDCSPIRLDESVKMSDGRVVEGSMVHVAVRDQEQIGSCYAHTSAQMYDAWRFRHGETDPADYANFSSGFEVGQRFKIDENAKVSWNSRLLDKDINGGFVKRLLPFLLREGTCSQVRINEIFEKQYNVNVDTYASGVMRRFNARRNDFHRVRDRILAKYGVKLKDVEAKESPGFIAIQVLTPMIIPNPLTWHARVSSAEAAQAKRLAAAKEEINVARLQALNDGQVELKASNQKYLVNKHLNIDYPALIAEAKQWTSDEVNTVKMFELIGVIACGDGEKLKTRGRFDVATTKSWTAGYNLFVENSPRYFPEASKAAVNAELNKGLAKAYPIGISYCSTIFGAGRKFTAKDWRDDKECGRHASLIIGRRHNPKNPNSCQYLIRNSWGKSCGSYNRDWDCEADKGAVWIDADTLGQSIHDLQTMRTIYD